MACGFVSLHSRVQDLTPYRGLNSPCRHSRLVSTKSLHAVAHALLPLTRKNCFSPIKESTRHNLGFEVLIEHGVTCRSSRGLAKTRIAPLFGFTSISWPSLRTTCPEFRASHFTDQTVPHLPARAPCEAKTISFINSTRLAAETTRNARLMLSTALFRQTGETNLLAEASLQLGTIQLPKSTRRHPKTSPCQSEQKYSTEQRHDPFQARVRHKNNPVCRNKPNRSRVRLAPELAPREKTSKKQLDLPKQIKSSFRHSPHLRQKLPSAENTMELCCHRAKSASSTSIFYSAKSKKSRLWISTLPQSRKILRFRRKPFAVKHSTPRLNLRTLLMFPESHSCITTRGGAS
jgi:hypothetical protein